MAKSTAPATKTTSTPRQQMVDPGELLDIMEVAERLHCGRTFAYQLISSGALPAIKMGRLLRVTEADLIAFIDQLRHESTWLIAS